MPMLCAKSLQSCLTLCNPMHYSPGEGNGTPLQYSCLENPMDGGAWWAAVHGVAKSRTRLSDFTFTSHFHALEKEMATHSSILAWRIPGRGEPGGLPSMGSQSWTQLKRLSSSSRLFNSFPSGTSGKEPACQCRRHKRGKFNPCVGKIPWRRAWQSTPVFLPGESPWTEVLGGLQSMGSQRSCTQWND